MSRNKLILLLGGMFVFTLGMGAPLAHETDIQIDNCVCEQACYTDEVANLTCSSSAAHS